MSYNLFATRDGVKYRARVAENIRDDEYATDIVEASDGGPIPDDPLNLVIPGYKTGDEIVFEREGDQFFFVKGDNVPS